MLYNYIAGLQPAQIFCFSLHLILLLLLLKSFVFSLLLPLRNSIVFPPPPPQFYCFSSSSSSSTILLFSLLLLLLNSIVFPRHPQFYCSQIIKYWRLLSLIHSTGMSRVVKNNRAFFQLLADCPMHQCKFLLRTATPQQIHALVQVLYNVLKQHIPFPEENRQKLLPYKDALISLAEPNVPYKKKKYIFVQEGGGFIQDLLPTVGISSVIKAITLFELDHFISCF